MTDVDPNPEVDPDLNLDAMDLHGKDLEDTDPDPHLDPDPDLGPELR